MIRTISAAVSVALLSGLFAVPAAALETTEGQPDADAILPVPELVDGDGDGLVATAARTTFQVEQRSIEIDHEEGEHEEHGHGDVLHSPASSTVALAGAPEMVILEEVPVGAQLAVRSRAANTWSDWTEVHATFEEGPDDEVRGPTTAIGPIWIGDHATHLEVAILQGSMHDIRVTGLHVSEPGVEPTASGVRGVRGLGEPRAAFASTTTGALVRPRSAWATSSMTWACSGSPPVAKELKAFVVHHSAGTNDYSRDQVPAVIRGIWYYHVKTRGWCDVAYNFVVDKYGGVWEGRQGGITKAIVGGHTFGFNTDTTAAVQLGDYQRTGTTTALDESTRRLIGWKLGLHGVDPASSTTVTNRTGSTFRGVPNGGQVPIRTVVGHRDLGSTTCPGDSTYARLPSFRSGARVPAHLHPLHRAFLQRTPIQADHARWLAVADRSGVGAAATGMARSAEYSGLIIDDLYRRVLGREPDAEGRRYWLDQLASGVRIEAVGIHFYGSSEYYAATGGPEGFVRALYKNLLHREPDPEGYAYWVSRLRAGTATPPDVATGFYMSVESRRDRVTRLYQAFLGRNPDRAGRDYWAQRLVGTDDIMLAVELSVSDEFYRRYLK